MRTRVTVERVKAAYQKLVGWIPVQKYFVRESFTEHAEKQCCALTAVMLAEDKLPLDWANALAENGPGGLGDAMEDSSELLNEALELESCYRDGFIVGFDGGPEDQMILPRWESMAHYRACWLEGWHDGVAAWDGVRELAGY